MKLNRRQFLQSLLAVVAAPAVVRASSLMPLARPARYVYSVPVVERLLPLRFGCIQEYVDSNYIDCTTLVSTAKEYLLGLRAYSYDLVHLELASESGRSVVGTLLADGRPVDLRKVSYFSSDRIVIEGLPLEEYGNRVPEFSFYREARMERRPT